MTNTTYRPWYRFGGRGKRYHRAAPGWHYTALAVCGRSIDGAGYILDDGEPFPGDHPPCKDCEKKETTP